MPRKPNPFIRELGSRVAITIFLTLVVLFILCGFTIAALVAVYGTWNDTNQLTHLHERGRATDYNPCSKDIVLHGAVDREEDKLTNKSCADWVCLADPGNNTATCQYDVITESEICVGTCAGACTISGDCPDLNFTALAPTPTVSCTSSTCLYDLDVSTVFVAEPLVPCSPTDPDYIRLCQNYLDFTANNIYIDQYCMRAIPVCNATASLINCQLKFVCGDYVATAPP